MRPYIAKLVALLAVFGLLMTVQISTAAADMAYDIDVHFEELTIDYNGYTVGVDYTIERDDWYRADRLGITPRFDLVVPGDLRRDTLIASDVAMEQRSGRLEFNGTYSLFVEQRVHFRPVSQYRSRRVGDVRLGGDFDITLEFLLDTGSATYHGPDDSRRGRDRGYDRDRGHDRDRGYDRDRSRDRGRDRDRSRDRGRDRDRSRDRGRDRDRSRDRGRDRNRSRDRGRDRSAEHRAAIIDACGENTTFESDREFCVNRAPEINRSYDAPDTVRACGDATSHSSHFQTCIDTAVAFESAPSRSVRACGNATSHGSHFADCLNAASRYDGDASPIIESCGRSTSFSSRVADCVRDSLP